METNKKTKVELSSDQLSGIIREALKQQGVDVDSIDVFIKNDSIEKVICEGTKIEKDKYLVLFRGLPSSGKTTAAELLFPKEHICSADDFFYNEEGVYIFNREKLHQAHRACQDKADNLMFAGVEKVAVCNTNTTKKEMAYYYKLAETYNYRVVQFIVERTHNNKNSHNVPDEAIEVMRNRFQINL